jgi:iron complex outermembrane receptor protein
MQPYRSACCAARVVCLTGTILAAPVLAQEVSGDVEYAQSAEAFEDGTLDDNTIIVTATKREQTLRDVPVAVTVTDEATIERAEIRDLRDLTSVQPSLKVTQLQSSANTNFIIRGFGNGANNAGIEPSVGVFVDGVYRSRSAAQIGDLPDLRRIEVLHGPQSTLFGKNASAGVISIITAEPQFTYGGQVEASYGNYDAIVGKALLTGPITDTIAASVAGGINMRDGYVEDLGTGDETNERNRWFARGQLLFQPGELLKLRLIADYNRIDENCCAVVTLTRGPTAPVIEALGGNIGDPANPFADEVYNNFSSTNDIKNYGVSGQIDFGVGAFELTSITAYRGTDALTDQDSDFSSADLLGRNAQDLRIRTFTQEFRARAEFGDNIDLLLGAFYFHEDIDQANRINFGSQFRPYASALIQQQTGGAFTAPALEQIIGAATGNPAAFVNRFFAEGQGLDENYTLDNEAISIFGQLDFALTDRLTLTAGANYTRDEKDFTANVVSSDVFSALDLQGISAADPRLAPLLRLQALQFLPPFLNVPNAVEDGNTSVDDLSYTLRAAYDVTGDVNAYVSYATGFKAPSINLSRDSRPLASDREAIEDAGIAVTNQAYGSRFAGAEEGRVRSGPLQLCRLSPDNHRVPVEYLHRHRLLPRQCGQAGGDWL